MLEKNQKDVLESQAKRIYPRGEIIETSSCGKLVAVIIKVPVASPSEATGMLITEIRYAVGCILLEPPYPFWTSHRLNKTTKKIKLTKEGEVCVLKVRGNTEIAIKPVVKTLPNGSFLSLEKT